MAILTIDDPIVAGLGLNPNEFMLAIAKAQAIAEGPQGANQRLEKRLVTSVLKLANGGCYLPVAPVDVEQPISVWVKAIRPQRSQFQGRQGVSYGNTFGRDRLSSFYIGSTGHRFSSFYSGSTGQREVLLGVGQYEFDPTTNRLSCYVNNATETPLSGSSRLSARVTYTAGYDFSPGSTDGRAIAMKAALLDMITANAAQHEGIESFTLDDFYSIKINQQNVQGVNDSALEVFRSLRRVAV